MACANIAVDAWPKIWYLVKVIISTAMSTSRIRLSAAVRFSAEVDRFAIVCSSLF